MPDVAGRRSWDGLGNHGFVYMDSLGDTGVTHVPRRSRQLGSTGTWGDPRWETLDFDETFYIFAIGSLGVGITGLLGRGLERWPDIVVITPPREKLRRTEQRPREPAPQVALEDVLDELRAAAGLPVGDLAKMLGVSRRQFYNWMSGENKPDLEHEQRVRHTAALVAQVRAKYDESRRVRAALLAETTYGSAFDALRVGDLAAAERAIGVTTATSDAREVAAPSQHVGYDRQRMLTELAHLRDAPLRGDG